MNKDISINKIKDNYTWEIQLKNDVIITKGNNFNINDVVRVSFIPQRILLPRHDLVISDFKFKKRFCRGIMNWSSVLKEYLHCVVTDNFRFYLMSSNGQSLITDSNYELYI